MTTTSLLCFQCLRLTAYAECVPVRRDGYDVPLMLPDGRTLCVECSAAATARIKARLAARARAEEATGDG